MILSSYGNISSGIKVYRTSALTGDVVTNTFKAIGWDTESGTKSGITHSTSTNNDQLVIVKPGIYLMVGCCTFTGLFGIIGLKTNVSVNGTATYTLESAIPLVSGNSGLGFSTILNLVAGDIVRVSFTGLGVGSIPILTGEANTWAQLIGL